MPAGTRRGTRLSAAIVARVKLRYDETKADLVHDEEYECVITPLDETIDVSDAIAVDYDDRDLRNEPPDGAVYRMTGAKLSNKTFFSGIETDLKEHLYRSMTIEIPGNADLKLYGRPGETTEQFEVRCAQAADDLADAEIAKLRDKYEAKVSKLSEQIAAAEDRVDVLEEEAKSKRNSELLSTAGSILGGLLGGKSRGGLLGKLGGAAGRRGRTKAAQERVDAVENKVERLQENLQDLEHELADEVTEIDARWMAAAGAVSPIEIPSRRRTSRSPNSCWAGSRAPDGPYDAARCRRGLSHQLSATSTRAISTASPITATGSLVTVSTISTTNAAKHPRAPHADSPRDMTEPWSTTPATFTAAKTMRKIVLATAEILDSPSPTASAMLAATVKCSPIGWFHVRRSSCGGSSPSDAIE